MEGILKNWHEVVEEKTDNQIAELVKNLAKIAHDHDPENTERVFERFMRPNVLNYISNSDLANVPISFKWSKEQVLNWLKTHDLDSFEDGVFCENALVLGMNYEYAEHADTAEKAGQNAPFVAYGLAVEALSKAGYIDKILQEQE